MKKILLTLSSLFAVGLCEAQWTPLNSTTTVTLNDVDFYDDTYGVIVGSANTILLTANGGINWTDINNHNISGDVYSVKIIAPDTIFVTTYDNNTATGVVYVTNNTGLTWTPVATDPTLNRPVDLETNALHGKLFASPGSLLSTNDYGTSWDTLVGGIAGTTSAQLLHFADSQTGHLSGNISGFITYSAYFFRTEDGGTHWYPGDVFSFPNSNAHTAMCFVNADTSYIFMNQYAGFMPSATNRLVRLYNFNLSIPTPGDTSYTFSSTIVNSAMPDYINDGRFENAMNGLALGNAGKIYRTVNGGSSWTVDYADTCSTCALLKMDFENGTGYAVGENGMLVKYGVSTGINQPENEIPVTIYPNPGTGVFMLKLNSPDKTLVEVLDPLGRKVLSQQAAGECKIDLSGYAKGVYIVKINGGEAAKKIVIQ